MDYQGGKMICRRGAGLILSFWAGMVLFPAVASAQTKAYEFSYSIFEREQTTPENSDSCKEDRNCIFLTFPIPPWDF
jgi:hypothetical protein